MSSSVYPALAFLKIYVNGRAKSEALDNIYSLLKQNIKSWNAKRRKQRRRTVKKNKSD